MNRNYIALELDKILEKLAQETAGYDAADMARELQPVFTAAQVQLLLDETDAAYVLMAKFGAPSFYGFTNVTNPARRAQAGGGLNMKELLDVAQTLRAIRGLKQWRCKSEGMRTALDARFYVLAPNKELEERIFTSIKSEDEMADAASAALAAIRRKIKNASATIRDKLDKLIHSSTHQKHLQDAIVTMRSGRFVVPVKAEYRGEVSGLVHDTSASGATVFIEPMAVVEANNEIRVLEAEEKEEINRILLALSAQVGEVAEELVESIQYATELDVIFAKGHLAYKMKAILPRINEQGRIRLQKARHPLIANDQVVPIDVSLGEQFDTLMITGPNTGGKTVALKTLGLLTLMAMCGLMIPAAEESEVSVFKNILADIGDEQSIEQSLSTFSAHMTNIIQILKTADERSLVLMDELGAGTDPVEGAALAAAIIDELRQKGAYIACTTHYAELKVYALQTRGVENACCEFDVATLRPTYRLLTGVPGKSNAFAISQKLGIPSHVVEQAKALVSGEATAFEDVVGRLEESRRKMEDEIRLAETKRAEAEKRAEDAQRLKHAAEQQAQKEIDRARQEAQQVVARTRARADALLSELEEIKKQKNKSLSAEQKAQMRAGMKELENISNPVRTRGNEGYQLPRALKVGDDVLIVDIDRKAAVLEAAKDGNVLVQAGIIKTRVPLSNLRLLSEKSLQKEAGQKKTRTVTKSILSAEVATEVDLRGQNAEEALMMVDTAIDNALLRGIARLTIIHGKGTGILRKAVQQHLRRCPGVDAFRLGTYGEGEDGVTIAELKQS